jgi:hypothetical protein
MNRQETIAWINARTVRWSDDAISLFLRRERLFLARGLSPGAAELLGDRLQLRDQELDTRAVCLECRGWMPDGSCSRAKYGKVPGASKAHGTIHHLQRCGGFACQPMS